MIKNIYESNICCPKCKHKFIVRTSFDKDYEDDRVFDGMKGLNQDVSNMINGMQKQISNTLKRLMKNFGK